MSVWIQMYLLGRHLTLTGNLQTNNKQITQDAAFNSLMKIGTMTCKMTVYQIQRNKLNIKHELF